MFGLITIESAEIMLRLVFLLMSGCLLVLGAGNDASNFQMARYFNLLMNNLKSEPKLLDIKTVVKNLAQKIQESEANQPIEIMKALKDESLRPTSMTTDKEIHHAETYATPDYQFLTHLKELDQVDQPKSCTLQSINQTLFAFDMLFKLENGYPNLESGESVLNFENELTQKYSKFHGFLRHYLAEHLDKCAQSIGAENDRYKSKGSSENGPEGQLDSGFAKGLAYLTMPNKKNMTRDEILFKLAYDKNKPSISPIRHFSNNHQGPCRQLVTKLEFVIDLPLFLQAISPRGGFSPDWRFKQLCEYYKYCTNRINADYTWSFSNI